MSDPLWHMSELLVEKLDPNAALPEKTRPHDGAYDIRALEGGVVNPGERLLVSTGLAIALPEGYVGLVLARSGLALKHGVAPANSPGLIDANYRGEVKVILENRSRNNFSFAAGDRIAQLLVIKEAEVLLREVDRLPESPDERGQDGFGSSGQQ